jgi:hypothetical protein
MHKHLIIFICSWGILSIALFIIPGFEMRGLAMGMLIGYWPALVSQQIYESQHHHPIIFLSMFRSNIAEGENGGVRREYVYNRLLTKLLI